MDKSKEKMIANLEAQKAKFNYQVNLIIEKVRKNYNTDTNNSPDIAVLDKLGSDIHNHYLILHECCTSIVMETNTEIGKLIEALSSDA